MVEISVANRGTVGLMVALYGLINGLYGAIVGLYGDNSRSIWC